MQMIHHHMRRQYIVILKLFIRAFQLPEDGTIAQKHVRGVITSYTTVNVVCAFVCLIIKNKNYIYVCPNAMTLHPSVAKCFHY
jgi:hypothetical protein